MHSRLLEQLVCTHYQLNVCLNLLSLLYSHNDFLCLFLYLLFFLFPFSETALHVTAKTMRLRMRKASQQPNPTLASRPSRTKRRHSEVEEDTPTTGRGLFSTIKKFIRGNAVKVTSSKLASPSLWAVKIKICRQRSYSPAVFFFLAVKEMKFFWARMLNTALKTNALSMSLSLTQCFLVESVMFPRKCLVECSSLSENSGSGLILASGSQSWCARTGGGNKWKSQLCLEMFVLWKDIWPFW